MTLGPVKKKWIRKSDRGQSDQQKFAPKAEAFIRAVTAQMEKKGSVWRQTPPDLATDWR